jgi:hypothetical protein
VPSPALLLCRGRALARLFFFLSSRAQRPDTFSACVVCTPALSVAEGSGRAVEGSWLDVNTGTVDGIIFPLPQASSRGPRRALRDSVGSLIESCPQSKDCLQRCTRPCARPSTAPRSSPVGAAFLGGLLFFLTVGARYNLSRLLSGSCLLPPSFL